MIRFILLLIIIIMIMIMIIVVLRSQARARRCLRTAWPSAAGLAIATPLAGKSLCYL